jgi:hypothetical protein
MLPQNQRFEPGGMVSSHPYIPNPVTLSIVMGGSNGGSDPLGICGTQKNEQSNLSNLKNYLGLPPLGWNIYEIQKLGGRGILYM